MRSSALYILTATLAAIALSCNPAGAATLTVHTQTPKVNIQVPTPKVPASGTATPVIHHDLSITRKVDKASPKLFEATSTGKHIPNGTVYDNKTKNSQDEQPQESFGFNYNKITIQNKPQ